MSPRERYNFLIDAEQREGLRRIKERDGIPESEQIRRAIDEWLEKKGVMKAGRTRARTRKRP
jgi:ribbon-helix-helix protein